MNIKFRVVIFFALILLAIAPELQAQTFTTIYSFSATNYDAALGYTSIPGFPPVGMTNSDGASPESALILSGNTLYGTASGGGTNTFGTLFAVSTNGTGFTNLYNFTDGTDGQNPMYALVLYGSNLYGTSPGGGVGLGTAFVINTNGTGFTAIHAFNQFNGDGVEPTGLTLCGTNLYGMAESYGGGGGVLFAINTNGPSYSHIVEFTPVQGYDFEGALISSGTNLYGTAAEGGHSSGLVFKVSTNGNAPVVLHSFAQGTGSSFWPNIINSDGAAPVDALVLSGDTLYGTTTSGGGVGNGSVFAVNTDGSGFTNLYFFSATNSNGYNDDGAKPRSSLILSGGILYGTALQGGAAGYGTIFAINTNGTGFTILHTFTGTNDGANPYAGLALSGGTLYGTTAFGGTNGNGTLFSITLPPPPPIIIGLNFSGTNLVINANGQAAGTIETLVSTNASLPFSQWTPVATKILTADGNFSITNTVDPTLPQCFYVLQAH